MRIHTLERCQTVGLPLEEVFAFFADPQNLDRLTPPWLHFGVRTAPPIAMQAGATIEYTIRWHGLPLRWLTEITEWIPGVRFVDVQLRGPYRLWHHTHRFAAVEGGTLVEDVVRYALPLGAVGNLVHTLFVRRDVERIFDFRARRMQELMGGCDPERLHHR